MVSVASVVSSPRILLQTPAKMSISQVRQNYNDETESLVNKQINMELYASYVYMSMSAHFDRDDVALHGFKKYFKDSSDEERGHAEKFIEYQNSRGGRVVLQNVNKPAVDEWGTPLQAMQAALDLEKQVNKSLLDMHKVAGSHNDAHLCDFLEREYLDEQVQAIKEIGDMITNLKRVGDGLGTYIFDKDLKQAS